MSRAASTYMATAMKPQKNMPRVNQMPTPASSCRPRRLRRGKGNHLFGDRHTPGANAAQAAGQLDDIIIGVGLGVDEGMQTHMRSVGLGRVTQADDEVGNQRIDRGEAIGTDH